MSIKRGGHTFERVDRPIRTPNHPSGKSHAVVIKKGEGYRLIRFGMQGAKTKPPRKGESDADKAKRKSFKASYQILSDLIEEMHRINPYYSNFSKVRSLQYHSLILDHPYYGHA